MKDEECVGDTRLLKQLGTIAPSALRTSTTRSAFPYGDFAGTIVPQMGLDKLDHRHLGEDGYRHAGCNRGAAGRNSVTPQRGRQRGGGVRF
jgi:hypothetical protein